jgi:dsDNA-specific endonuclease/ATPase MutS2
LNDAREKLDRVQSGQQLVRGKEKKIESLKTSIAELERKVLHLRNAASNSSIERLWQEPMQIDDEVAERWARRSCNFFY